MKSVPRKILKLKMLVSIKNNNYNVQSVNQLQFILFQQVFASVIVLLMKKASKDKRYGQIKSDDRSKRNHHSYENTASYYAGHKYTVTQTYPPGTIIRNQPTSQCHAPKERVNNSNLTPQSRKPNSHFCC